jgi:hypothetical protein
MLTTWHPLSAKVGNHFADKRRSLVGIVRSRTQTMEFVCLFISTEKWTQYVLKSSNLISAIQNRSRHIRISIGNDYEDQPELIGFWILSIVRYSGNKKALFLDLTPSSGDAGDTYSVGSQWLRLVTSKGPKQSSCLLPQLRAETDPVSETMCFSF